LVKVEGKILEGKKEVAYSEAGYRQKDVDIDGAIVDSLAREIMWRQNSMGLMAYWGPLESKNLEKYAYKLEGEERHHDYDVYRITFREKEDKWEGEGSHCRHDRSGNECKTDRRENHVQAVRQGCLVSGPVRRRDETARAVSLRPNHRLQRSEPGLPQSRRPNL
jgi:hypothetical protein